MAGMLLNRKYHSRKQHSGHHQHQAGYQHSCHLCTGNSGDKQPKANDTKMKSSGYGNQPKQAACNRNMKDIDRKQQNRNQIDKRQHKVRHCLCKNDKQRLYGRNQQRTSIVPVSFSRTMEMEVIIAQISIRISPITPGTKL